MGWDWKKGLGKLFGGGAGGGADVGAAPLLQEEHAAVPAAAVPEAEEPQLQEPLAAQPVPYVSNTHRAYTAAEVERIIGIRRVINGIHETNTQAIESLSRCALDQRTPDLLSTFSLIKEKSGEGLKNTQQGHSLWDASDLEEARLQEARTDDLHPQDGHLPVRDKDRILLANTMDLAAQVMKVMQAMRTLLDQAGKIYDVPRLDALKKAYSRHEVETELMLGNLFQLNSELNGKPPAPAAGADRQPVLAP